MFIPKLYKNENTNEIIEYVQKNNFGIIISLNAQNRIIATHIPFVIKTKNGKIILETHVAKSNEQWQSLAMQQEVLVIFQGEHSYISSSWYDHVNVPTWNYIATHFYGKVRMLNHDDTYTHLDELTEQHEKQEVHRISVKNLPPGYVEREMKGLVAFAIDVHEVQSAFKLSQNRNKKNADNIINELQKRGDDFSLAIAQAMKKISFKNT